MFGTAGAFSLALHDRTGGQQVVRVWYGCARLRSLFSVLHRSPLYGFTRHVFCWWIRRPTRSCGFLWYAGLRRQIMLSWFRAQYRAINWRSNYQTPSLAQRDRRFNACAAKGIKAFSQSLVLLFWQISLAGRKCPGLLKLTVDETVFWVGSLLRMYFLTSDDSCGFKIHCCQIFSSFISSRRTL
jgi:hypothetical protein